MRTLPRAVLLAAGLLLTQGLHAQDGDPLRQCEQSFEKDPERADAGTCFASLPPGLVPEAVAWLGDYVRRSPRSPWAWLHLGLLKQDGGEQPRFGDLLRAAALFADRQQVDGEVLARYFLYERIKEVNLELAALEVEHAKRAVAARAVDPRLLARVHLLEARYLREAGRDLGRADALLKSSQGLILQGSRPKLKATWWLTRGNVSFETGDMDGARDAYRTLLELTDDASQVALARYGLTRVLLEERVERPERVSREEVRAATAKALAAAREGKAGASVLDELWILGMLAPGREAEGYFTQCLAAARDDENRSYCQAGWARRLAAEDPAAARKLVAGSRGALAKSDWTRAYFTSGAIRALWHGGAPPEEAIAELDAIETLRALQTGPSQAGLFSIWSDDFYWLSGKLLASPPGQPRAVEQAFTVIEKLRARTLLDTLVREVRAPVSEASLRSRLAEIASAAEIVEQRANDPSLPEVRPGARRDLALLEGRRHEVERELGRATGRAGGRQALASLAEVQGALGDDEALLSFQIAPWKDWTDDFGGGSWLVVVTRGELPRVYKLAAGGDGREKLRRDVCRLLEQITGDRDPACGVVHGSPARQDQALYQSLLAEAVQKLPAGVRRLIIVPDGPLYKLPFAALRPSAREEPLGSRFQISEEPSATLWLYWRNRRSSRPVAAAGPALALADPAVPGAGAPLESLDRLPEARAEAAAVVRSLQGGSARWAGHEVSERRFKEVFRSPPPSTRQRPGLVHFALHAVVYDREPERSGLWLSPGSPQEDGLLTIGEIAELPLAGQVVVLSTCRSAAGQVLRGEGTLSVTRAFLQAGAQVVVGSLWPLDDRAAADLFSRFYRHLGSGRSVAAALQAAQRECQAAGAPRKAWAGLVVLGDGDFVPFPGGRERPPGVRLATAWPWAAATGILLLVLLLGGLARRRRSQELRDSKRWPGAIG